MSRKLAYTRRADELGRITLPKEVLRAWGQRPLLSIAWENEQFVLTRAVHHCVVCGSENNLTPIQDGGNHICSRCVNGIATTQEVQHG